MKNFEVTKTVTWFLGKPKKFKLKPPSKKHKLINFEARPKSQRSAINESRELYTRVVAYWGKT